ncbi:MAG TPA: 4Fe-4S binding protein, partial [Gemmatimonadales bacterium]
HGDDEMLYIDNNVCIDCGACVPVCPVHAIFEEADLPEDMQMWIAINAERAPGLPNVTEKEDPLPTAEARKAELGY